MKVVKVLTSKADDRVVFVRDDGAHIPFTLSMWSPSTGLHKDVVDQVDDWGMMKPEECEGYVDETAKWLSK